MSNAADLQRENEQLKAQLSNQKDYIKQFEEALIKTLQQQYGASSEKLPSKQLALIQKLYAIERQIKDKPVDERYQIRQTLYFRKVKTA